MEKMYSPQPMTSTAAKGISCSGWSSPPRNRPWTAASSRVKEAVSISFKGEAASREKPVKMRRRLRGSTSVFHRVRVVPPRVMVSPMFTSWRPSTFLWLT